MYQRPCLKPFINLLKYFFCKPLHGMQHLHISHLSVVNGYKASTDKHTEMHLPLTAKTGTLSF